MFFNKIKEQTLRRLYKVILKRIIGQYLESELLLEQLQVNSGEGIVIIKNLKLNCKVLNEYLLQSPLKLIDAEILELNATISYNSILNDGCKITCKGVKLVLSSQSNNNNNNNNNNNTTTFSQQQQQQQELSSTPSNDYFKKSSQNQKPELNFETETFQDNLAEDSIGFIAQWIEVIIARLKANCEDLHIFLVSDNTPIALHLELNNLEFYNSHPRSIPNHDGGSVIAASSIYNEGKSLTNSLIAAMSNRKLIKLQSLSLNMMKKNDLNLLISLESFQNLMVQVCICKLNSGATVDIQLSASSPLSYGSVDIDLTIPSLQLQLKTSNISNLLQFMTSISENNVKQGNTQTSSNTSKSKSKNQNVVATDFSGIGSDIIRLEEGIRQLHLNQTVNYLKKLEGDESKSDEINFPRLTRLLQQYQLARERLEDMSNSSINLAINTVQSSTPTNNIMNENFIDDSNIEFPDESFDENSFLGDNEEKENNQSEFLDDKDEEDEEDEDDDDDFEFHDASEGRVRLTKKIKSSMTHSIYGSTSVSQFQHMFLTAETPINNETLGLSRSAEIKKSQSGIFFRIFVDTTKITFENDQVSPSNELNLTIKSSVFTSTLASNISPSFSLNFSEIFLYEKHPDPFNHENIIENTILYFSIQNPNEDNLIIPNHINDFSKPIEPLSLAGPQMELSIIFKPISEDGMNITINFQHTKCVLSLDTLERWSSVISESFGTQTSPSSSLAFSCSINIKSLDLILKEISENINTKEERLKQKQNLPSLSTLQERTYKNRWKKYQPTLNYNVNNISKSTVSLRFVFHSICILINPNTIISPFSIIMDKINCFMLIPDIIPSHTIWELGFFTIRSGITESKIKIIKEKYEGPEGVTSKSIEEESERLLLGDNFEMPNLDIHENFIVTAGQIQLDLYHTEYITLMTILQLLTPSQEENKKNCELSTSIEPTQSELTNSLNTTKLNENNISTFGIKITSNLLLIRLSEDNNNNNNNNNENNNNSFTYNFSIREPLVEVYSLRNNEGSTQYIGLLASDISLYEIPNNTPLNNKIGRELNCKGIRVGENSSNIPFIHRTSLEKSWISSDFQRSKHRVLGLRILTREEIQHNNIPTQKTSNIHLSLKNMTYRFIPSPEWINKITIFFNIPSSSTSINNSNNNSVQTSSTFGKTHLNLSVQKLIIDFCQPKLSDSSQSRIILYVGLLSVNSTLVSNSPRMGLKIKLSDVSIRLSNKLLNNSSLEQSPLDSIGLYPEEYQSQEKGLLKLDQNNTTNDNNNHDKTIHSLDLDMFYDIHGFVIMGTLDNIECRLDFNTDTRNKHYVSDHLKLPIMSVEATAGVFYFYGCADSLLTLTNTCTYLSETISQSTKSDTVVETELENNDSTDYELDENSPNSSLNKYDNIQQNNININNDGNNNNHNNTKQISNISLKPRLVPAPVRQTRNRLSDFEESLSYDEEDNKDNSNNDKFQVNLDNQQSLKDTKTKENDTLLKSSWMKGISEDMFRPRSMIQNDENIKHDERDYESVSEATEKNDNSEFSATIGGLNQALIEDYYPGRENVESPEFEAKYYPQYDYEDDDQSQDLEMSGFQAIYDEDEEDDNSNNDHNDHNNDNNNNTMNQSKYLSKSLKNNQINSSTRFNKTMISDSFGEEDEQEDNSTIVSGQFGTQYSDSDSDGDGDGESNNHNEILGGRTRIKEKIAPAMWESWGALRNVNLTQNKYEDIELNSVHSFENSYEENLLIENRKSHHDSFDLVGENLKNLKFEEKHDEDNISLPSFNETKRHSGNFFQVAQGPIDEDMHRAWQTNIEDLHENDIDYLAGWYGEAPKITQHHIPIPALEDLHTIEDDQSFPRIKIKVSLSIRIRLFSGKEWSLIPPPSLSSSSLTSSISTSLTTSINSNLSTKSNSSSGVLNSTNKALSGNLMNNSSISGINNLDQPVSRSVLFKEPGPDRRKEISKELIQSKKHSTTQKKVSNSQSSYGRNSADVTEISFTNVVLHFRTYSENKRKDKRSQSSMPALKEQPLRRIVVKIHDMLVSFSPVGKKPKKILGYWKNYPKPIESDKPLLELSLNGISVQPHTQTNPTSLEDNLEYRLILSVLPLRCYLDGKYVDFCKNFALAFTKSDNNNNNHNNNNNNDNDNININNSNNNKTSEVETNLSLSESQLQNNGLNVKTVTTASPIQMGKPHGSVLAPSYSNGIPEVTQLDNSIVSPSNQSNIYFQSWQVKMIDLKIDYIPDQLDLQALQHGDYTQLLNLLSIDGLEITLTQVRLSGIAGVQAGIEKCLEEWINEIYAHQMHRLLSGASPLRGISNIGANIQGLLMIPVQEYKKKGAIGVLKALQRQSVSLISAITQETLQASHQLSHFIANTLVDLVAPESSNNSSQRQTRDHNEMRQPVGFLDSLDLAYDAISREIHSTLDTIVVLPVRQYTRSGPGGYLRSVIRAIPVAILRPTAGAAEALSYTLLGLRNNLDPTKRKDEEDMWDVNHSGIIKKRIVKK